MEEEDDVEEEEEEEGGADGDDGGNEEVVVRWPTVCLLATSAPSLSAKVCFLVNSPATWPSMVANSAIAA
jgi:hypothetical protein